jgi:hypothetical protein
MRSIELRLASALMAAFLFAGLSVAQQPDTKKESPRESDRPAPISVNDLVDWIMSFDKNKDGKITKDELPERMQFLIEKGDTNKDGALDRDEIKKLVSTPTGPGQFGFGGPGPGGFGFARTGGPGAVGGVGFAGPGPGGVVESVVDDLKLTGKKKDRALAVAMAHQENVRKLMDQARSEMLHKMKEVLSDEEFKDFQAALDRPRGVSGVFVGPPDAPRPGEIERKLDQLQKEVEELRRQRR